MTLPAPALRARYLGDSVSTASPARLLVMLYERLALDLAQAEAALTTGDRVAASARLLHAQEIVIELRTTLKLEAWEGALNLAKIYAFLLSELIAANVGADAAKVAGCRSLVEPLLSAWREAALTPTAPAAA